MAIELSEGMDWPASPDIVSLWGECGEWSMPGSLWWVLLTLAQRYGWEPAGTLPPHPDYVDEFDALGRDGSYYPPDGQRMTSEDVRNFADALERLLLDIPDKSETEEEAAGDPYAGWAQESSSVMHKLGAIRSILRSLVLHCQQELWLC